MTDRELLELAAKAAALDVRQTKAKVEGLLIAGKFNGDYFTWNPLTDDGDTFRLAVKLRIKFRFNEALGQGLAWVGGENDFEARANFENCGRDENACARRAIVRAAAEIGRLHAYR